MIFNGTSFGTNLRAKLKARGFSAGSMRFFKSGHKCLPCINLLCSRVKEPSGWWKQKWRTKGILHNFPLFSRFCFWHASCHNGEERGIKIDWSFNDVLSVWSAVLRFPTSCYFYAPAVQMCNFTKLICFLFQRKYFAHVSLWKFNENSVLNFPGKIYEKRWQGHLIRIFLLCTKTF